MKFRYFSLKFQYFRVQVDWNDREYIPYILSISNQYKSESKYTEKSVYTKKIEISQYCLSMDMLQIFLHSSVNKSQQTPACCCSWLARAPLRASRGALLSAAGPMGQKQVVPVGFARNCRPQPRKQLGRPTEKA